MEYNVCLIARHIIRKTPVNNLKLQCILYYIQAQFLCEKGVPCFNAEIEAWDVGPVIPNIYYKYKPFGNGNIIPFESDWFYVKEEDRKMVDEVIDLCDKFSTTRLLELISQQTPWQEARIKSNKIITEESIKEYFTNLSDYLTE